MPFKRPQVEVPGDDCRHIMARLGETTDENHTLAVWRFGFLPQSEWARQYGVTSGDGFLWVLANREGTIIETFFGYACKLPQSFVIEVY